MPGQHGRSTQTEPNDVARPEPQADEQEKNRTAPRANGRQKLSEIDCKPTGAECEGTASGKKAKVTMYFNGPTLVQLETVGADVIKRQFTVREQPEILEIEVIPIIGNAKSETLHLKRMPRSTGNH